MQQGLVILAGSFAPNGSSAISAASNKGKGFSVVRTSAGLYTITLADRYAALVSIVVMPQLATGADSGLQVGTCAVSGTAANTIQIRNWDASDAAVADIAADANNRINFVLILRNTSVN